MGYSWLLNAPATTAPSVTAVFSSWLMVTVLVWPPVAVCFVVGLFTFLSLLVLLLRAAESYSLFWFSRCSGPCSTSRSSALLLCVVEGGVGCRGSGGRAVSSSSCTTSMRAVIGSGATKSVPWSTRARRVIWERPVKSIAAAGGPRLPMLLGRHSQPSSPPAEPQHWAAGCGRHWSLAAHDPAPSRKSLRHLSW